MNDTESSPVEIEWQHLGETIQLSYLRGNSYVQVSHPCPQLCQIPIRLPPKPVVHPSLLWDFMHSTPSCCVRFLFFLNFSTPFPPAIFYFRIEQAAHGNLCDFGENGCETKCTAWLHSMCREIRMKLEMKRRWIWWSRKAGRQEEIYKKWGGLQIPSSGKKLYLLSARQKDAGR